MLNTLKIMICLIMILVMNANSQTWQKVSGVKPYVNTIMIQPSNSSMVAIGADDLPTDIMQSTIEFPFMGSGLYISTDGGNTFPTKKLDNYSIYELYSSKKNNNFWLASARSLTLGRLLYSTDNGTSWEEGSQKCEGSFQISHITSNIVNDKEIFYACAMNLSQGLKYSEDAFDNCITIDKVQIQVRDLKISKNNSNLIFAVGEDQSKGGLYRSLDGGKNWINLSTKLKGLRILTVVPSTTNFAKVLIGADSITQGSGFIGKGIYMSIDSGNNWKLVGAEGANVFDIQEHPTASQKLVAACGDKGIFASGNGGNSWTQFNSGLPANASARKVEIFDNNPTNGLTVLTSIFGDGLYKINSLITDVVEIQTDYSKKYLKSNILDNKLYLALGSFDVDIRIIDSYGNIVLDSKSGITNTFDISHLANGVYFISFISNKSIEFEKFIKVN